MGTPKAVEKLMGYPTKDDGEDDELYIVFM